MMYHLSMTNITYNGIAVSKSDITRFWQKVKKTNDCWNWDNTLRGGYGMFSFNGKPVGAHRFSFAIEHGSIKEGAFVLHGCDNPQCVRPKHLRLGTNSDNMIDRSMRNRNVTLLTPELVTKARDTVFTIDEAKRFAKTHGLEHTTVISAITGKSWGHLKTIKPHEVVNKREQGTKLSREQATALKKELFANINQWGILTRLAKKYGVTKETVYGIKIGKSWSHIDVS